MSIAITAVHLKRIGNKAIVAIEVDGRWVDVIEERADDSYSHIIELTGLQTAIELSK